MKRHDIARRPVPRARLAGRIAQGERFGPADPVVEDEKQLDPKRPIDAEMQASVPDGFTAAAVGDLIISRPLSQLARRCRLSPPSSKSCAARMLTFGNLETTIFDPRTFEGAPYSWDGDWTNASLPAVAYDLKSMGFDIVGRANNHSQDWGLEGMRETARWLDDAGIAHAGAGESHRMARAPAYFESAKGRIALVSIASTFRPTSESLPPAATAPGRPGLSALRVRETVAAPKSAVEALAKAQCALYGKHCDGAPREGSLFGTSYRQADRLLVRVHDGSERSRRDLCRHPRAQLNADFVIVAIHSHECSLGCDGDNAPHGAANFLKELARGAIDSGADMFVTTGNHNLGPIEIYDSPEPRQAADLLRARQLLLERRAGAAAGRPVRQESRTAHRNLAAPGAGDRVRPDRAAQHELLRECVHLPERDRGSPLQRQRALRGRAASGGARLRRPADDERHSAAGRDEALSRKIVGQVVEQTAQFGLPALQLRYDGARAVIATGR